MVDGEWLIVKLPPMTVLQQMEEGEKRRREQMRLAARAELRTALREFLPAQTVIVFGSLVRPDRFREVSDIDVAIESEPSGMTVCRLTSLLGERLGRRIDIISLPECRFRDRILREGETWTPQD
jgi:predicted nucleotidyltransferase